MALTKGSYMTNTAKPKSTKKVDPKKLKSKAALLGRFDDMIEEVVQDKTTNILYDNGGSPVAAIVPYEAVEILEEVMKNQDDDSRPGAPATKDDEIIGKLPLCILQQLMGGKTH